MTNIVTLQNDILAQLRDEARAPQSLVDLARRLVDSHPNTSLHEIIAIVRLLVQRDPNLKERAITMLGDQGFMLHGSIITLA